MPFPPIIAIVLIVRAIAYAMQSSEPQPPGTTPWSNALAVALVELLVVGALVAFTPMFPPAILVALAVGLLMFPWPLAYFVAVPLGAVRVAYHLGRWSDLVWRLDHARSGTRSARNQPMPSIRRFAATRSPRAQPSRPAASSAPGSTGCTAASLSSSHARLSDRGASWRSTARVPATSAPPS